jgi:hypothetical protein
LHIDEFSDLNPSTDTVWVMKSRRMQWVGHGADIRRKEPLGRCRHRWKDNIVVVNKEIG